MVYLNNISPASACFPGYPLETSIKFLFEKEPTEKFIKNWNYDHIQLCPQHIGFISEKSAKEFSSKYQNTNFRLHANARLFTKLKPFDAGSNLKENEEYIHNLKKISTILCSKAYSYHAPMSDFFNWWGIRDNVLRLQDFLGIPVAIEGLYPMKKKTYWDNSLKIYETFLNGDLNYALDLSHLNIAYQQMKIVEQKEFTELAIKMINDSKCLEIHISGNDGVHDKHTPITGDEWWFNVLEQLTNQNAIIFCESKQN